jgi:hypothetical protein
LVAAPRFRFRGAGRLRQDQQERGPSGGQREAPAINRTYWWIIPLFFAVMLSNYLDRINIAFAHEAPKPRRSACKPAREGAGRLIA